LRSSGDNRSRIGRRPVRCRLTRKSQITALPFLIILRFVSVLVCILLPFKPPRCQWHPHLARPCVPLYPLEAAGDSQRPSAPRSLPPLSRDRPLPLPPDPIHSQRLFRERRRRDDRSSACQTSPSWLGWLRMPRREQESRLRGRSNGSMRGKSCRKWASRSRTDRRDTLRLRRHCRLSRILSS
jgi:hypothetical protein